MRSNALFFETLNSVYFIDPDAKQYFRIPKAGTEEQPIHSDRLTYAEWHDMKDEEPLYILFRDRLHFKEVSSNHGIITSVVVRSGLASDYEE